MDDTGIVLAGGKLFRAALWEATENELMIRVQADRDGALELQCLADGCSWEWDTGAPEVPYIDASLGELLRRAVDHQCPTPAPVRDRQWY
jgi:hypothetical protein